MPVRRGRKLGFMVYLDDDVLAGIDSSRGDTKRNTWIEKNLKKLVKA